MVLATTSPFASEFPGELLGNGDPRARRRLVLAWVTLGFDGALRPQVDSTSDPRLVPSRPRALVAATGEKRHGQGDDEYSTHAHVAETSTHASGFRQNPDA